MKRLVKNSKFSRSQQKICILYREELKGCQCEKDFSCSINNSRKGGFKWLKIKTSNIYLSRGQLP